MEKLKVSIGKTYNLGNYESLRLDVGLEVEFDALIIDTQARKESIFVDTHNEVLNMLERMEKLQNVSKRR